jgi:hypothetical protein
MLRTIAILLGAFSVIAVAFAINIGLGILIAILAYGAVDGLLSKPD